MITAAFLLAGLVWVFVTDVLLYSLVRDGATIARVETAKGWTFVGLAALMVFLLFDRYLVRGAQDRATITAIVDSMADGVFLLGPDRRISHANPAAVAMLRCRDAAELLGVGAEEFARRFHVQLPDGSVVPPERFASQRVFDEGGTIRYKAVLEPRPGKPLVVAVIASVVRASEAGSVDQVVAVMHDITASEHLEDLRDEFLAAAAHSLKTPVAVIKAHTQVLARETPEQRERSIEAIVRQCGRLDRLVQNLLLLARVRSNTLQLHTREMELAPVVERVAADVDAIGSAHRVSAEIAGRPRVFGDEERLSMMLRNMVAAACRQAERGTRITVRLACSDHHAEIVVRHRLPRSPAEHEDVPHYDDLTVGRCVAQQIADAHGAELWRESRGEDVLVHIRMPTLEASDAAA